MRDLERLLTGAYPEGLRDVPPAPVRKSAVRDKTFEKLGLERPERQPLPHEQWSQAEPVVKRRRPWAMVAACLAVVALVGAALWALPLATAPGQGQSGPLPAGTYLECSVTEAAFDEESWSMVLTAEATTDLDLDNPNAATGYGISANVAMTTDYSRISFGGLDPDTLTRWTETGENTYRCEDILVEVDPEFQMVNVLIGQLDLNLELYVGFGEQNTAGTWEDFLLADAPFTLELPMPEGSRLDFVRPNPPATYFTCQAVEAAFSQEQQALVFTLEAQTDMDLDNADCQSLYSFLYTLTFQGENGAYQYPSYDGATVDALAHWTQTGEDTYRCEGFTVPVDLALLAEQGITGTAAGTLDLVVTDTSYVGAEDPWQFFPSVEFAVELNPVTDAAPGPGTYLDTASGSTALIANFDDATGTLYAGAIVATDMDLDNIQANKFYQWDSQLTLSGNNGQAVTLEPAQNTSYSWDTFSPAYGSTLENTYQLQGGISFPLSSQEYPSAREFWEAHQLYGTVEGTLTLSCDQQFITGDTEPLTVEIPLSVEMPGRNTPPAPGTHLDSLQVTASNYEEDTGRLTLQASLASDMYLASPYAEDYYQWEAKVSLTGQQGRTCTLTAGPGQPAWQQLQKEDGSARDVFASESLFTFDLETRGAVEEYDLYGTIQGTLTLTCRETVDGSTKDWEVEVPFTVEFPGDYYHLSF